MIVSLITVVAVVMVGMTCAKSDNEVRVAEAPELPEGLFAGTYNKDGTTTLKFPELNETFTFEGLAEPPVRRDLTKVQKRAPSSCWSGPNLNRQGVDRGIQAFRDLFNGRPNERGYLGNKYGIDYFGYNFDGVYVYFCYNDGSIYAAGDNYDIVDLNFAVGNMDRECGIYRPGYYPWNSPSLWGKCVSGTRVCLGAA